MTEIQNKKWPTGPFVRYIWALVWNLEFRLYYPFTCHLFAAFFFFFLFCFGHCNLGFVIWNFDFWSSFVPKKGKYSF